MIPPLVENGFWLVLIPGSTTLQNSSVPRPRVGQALSVLGAWRPPLEGTSAMRARILLISGKYYRLQ